MQGSLALHRDLLFVARHARTAHVRAFDLTGRPTAVGFSFRDERFGRSTACGIDVDDEGRVWIADVAASRLRVFTVFGREVGGLGLSAERSPEALDPERDEPGLVREPVDVLVRGDADRLRVVVACAGPRRHGVQVFDEGARLVRSLRPLGDPRGRFRGVRRLASRGRLLYVVERDAARVQVFRDLEFHYAFALEDGAAVPTALAALSDGRLVVGTGGAEPGLLLCDRGGRELRRLAPAGEEEGRVSEVEDLVVAEGRRDGDTRVVALDADGERVQVFTLEGRCHGAFQRLA